jgi:hypothetical protein
VFSNICGVTALIAGTILSFSSLRVGHRGFVNNVLNVSPQEEIKWHSIGVSAEVTELVHHIQPSAQENACQEILGQYEPNVGVHHLAGTPHVADDLPAVITDTTVACPGRSSLSLFCKGQGPQNF